MPGVRVPSWALPNDNGPQTQFIQGVMREDAQVGSRYVVSRTATSRVPLPIVSKYCYKQESAYFEVTFERDGTTVPSPSDFLAVMVGLVSKPHLDKPTHLPAHDSFAVSYESLYGQAMLGPHNGEGVLYGPSYSFGDTVGVGIIPYYAPLSNNTAPPPSELLYTDKTPHACTIFFTRNGQFIGDVINRFSSDLLSYEKSLFPAIGFVTSKIPVIAKVNFGLSSFKFQMKSHVSNILKNDLAMQSRVHPQQTIKNHTVLRYLRPSPSDSTTPHQMVINSRGPTRNTTQQTPTIQTLTPTSQRVHFPACPTFHSIQSPTPLRPGTSFRVKILSNTPTDSTFLAIGVALRPYSAYYHVGWDFGSFAYHSDDGKLFDGTGQGGFAWGDPYTVGDEWRECGTVEGVEVTGVVPAGWFEWRLHPTVSACQEWVVDVEFEEEL
ncbi:hypothetical protein HDU79_008868 [Rhizoclosmatium sp. JEL0117]|nr:hypothetical protein HDU79_008868 [Rhizoclosmatium sp. JEL0117]